MGLKAQSKTFKCTTTIFKSLSQLTYRRSLLCSCLLTVTLLFPLGCSKTELGIYPVRREVKVLGRLSLKKSFDIFVLSTIFTKSRSHLLVLKLTKTILTGLVGVFT